MRCVWVFFTNTLFILFWLLITVVVVVCGKFAMPIDGRGWAFVLFPLDFRRWAFVLFPLNICAKGARGCSE